MRLVFHESIAAPVGEPLELWDFRTNLPLVCSRKMRSSVQFCLTSLSRG